MSVAILVHADCTGQCTFPTKGFTPPPRCPDCRRRRQAEKMAGGDGGGGRSHGW